MNQYDDISKSILIHLNSEAESTTSELAETADARNEQIRYRIKNGALETLVEQAGVEPQPGARHDTHIWTLTNEGERAVQEVLESPEMTLKGLLTWTKELAGRVDDLANKTEEASETATEARNIAAGVKGGLKRELRNDLELRIPEAVEEEVEEQLDAYAIRDKLAELDGETGRLGQNLDSLESDLEKIESHIDDLEAEQERLNKRISKIESQSVWDEILPWR